jgi:hypothetical protein
MSEWKPIETAPKKDPKGYNQFEGPDILVSDGYEIKVAHWTTAYPSNGDWSYAWNDDDYIGYPKTIRPTHWKPLPDMPKRKKR